MNLNPSKLSQTNLMSCNDNDQLIKQMIGSIDTTYEGIFNDIEYDDQDGK